MHTKPRLGRGLDALLGETHESGDGSTATLDPTTPTSRLPIELIQHNPYQPRKQFDDDELLQLSESIRNHGILQPLVVRPVGEHYQLIAGERRLRAAQVAGLAEVPVHIVDFNDQQVLEAALVENIQRTDLNPIEKAQGFKDYLDRFGMTQEQLAQRLGMDRTSVSNFVNLLNLPPEVQDAVRANQIHLGHAKILKGVSSPAEQIALCKETIQKGLSVKALELLVKERKNSKAEAGSDTSAQGETSKIVVEKSSHVLGIENEIRQKLAVRFEVKLKAKDKGQIVIGFESNDDFERIIETLRR